MITKQRPIEHDSKRCPECSTRGTIVEFQTTSDDVAKGKAAGTDASHEWKRVRARVFECQTDGCETRWIKRA